MNSEDLREMNEIAPCSESEEVKREGLSRRKFLSRGALAVGAAGATVAATGGLGLLSGSYATAQPTCATIPGVVKHPWGTWGYTPLDPDACAERAYQGWYSHACCWAVVDGILGTLQESLGSPYTNIDLMAFKFGAGGINGWGTICGTALGAALSTNIVAGSQGSNMSKDLLAYYSSTALPVHIPGAVVYPYTPPSSASDSPLCHVSVGKWMKVSGGYTFGSAERKERCARLSGDMARKTAELLNAWDAASYTPGAWGGPASGMTGQNNCTDCHDVETDPDGDSNLVPNPLNPASW